MGFSHSNKRNQGGKIKCTLPRSSVLPFADFQKYFFPRCTMTNIVRKSPFLVHIQRALQRNKSNRRKQHLVDFQTWWAINEFNLNIILVDNSRKLSKTEHKGFHTSYGIFCILFQKNILRSILNKAMVCGTGGQCFSNFWSGIHSGKVTSCLKLNAMKHFSVLWLKRLSKTLLLLFCRDWSKS